MGWFSPDHVDENYHAVAETSSALGIAISTSYQVRKRAVGSLNIRSLVPRLYSLCYDKVERVAHLCSVLNVSYVYLSMRPD